MIKIAVFVGSLQKKSYNKLLAENLLKVAPEGVEFTHINLDLPLFNEDLEADFPASIQHIKDIVESSDGVLFATPEYNRSIPGVLKNAIDWVSRPYGDNSFAGKPAGIVGATVSATGTVVAQSDLQHIVAFLEMKIMGQPSIHMSSAYSVFDENGVVSDERWLKNVKAYIEAFTVWVKNEK